MMGKAIAAGQLHVVINDKTRIGFAAVVQTDCFDNPAASQHHCFRVGHAGDRLVIERHILYAFDAIANCVHYLLVIFKLACLKVAYRTTRVN